MREDLCTAWVRFNAIWTPAREPLSFQLLSWILINSGVQINYGVLKREAVGSGFLGNFCVCLISVNFIISDELFSRVSGHEIGAHLQPGCCNFSRAGQIAAIPVFQLVISLQPSPAAVRLFPEVHVRHWLVLIFYCPSLVWQTIFWILLSSAPVEKQACSRHSVIFSVDFDFFSSRACCLPHNILLTILSYICIIWRINNYLSDESRLIFVFLIVFKSWM